VASLAASACNTSERIAVPGPTTVQVGPIGTWGADSPKPMGCPIATLPGAKIQHFFDTPIGFVHISEFGLKDWRRTLDVIKRTSIKKFASLVKGQRGRDAMFVQSNNQFFQSQITNPDHAVRNPQEWPQLYNSAEYKEWTNAAKQLCSSLMRKTGAPLADSEEDMDLVTWAAVYPPFKKGDPITHYYHAHQESLVSFVLYVEMPEPQTPLTISDPRGAGPVEDFEWFQGRGDLGIDSEPPFHRPFEFYAGTGDILVFPSYAIHKVPPHFGNKTRVVFPGNCHLKKRRSKLGEENPLDGWERLARWSRAIGVRPGASAAYYAHAQAAVALATQLEDPYMKMWEAQNQVVAMLQMSPGDAKVWVEAGNISTHLAIVLSARNEGDYFPDAVTFFAHALRIDAGIQPLIDSCLTGLKPKRVPRELKAGYAEAQKWVQQIKGWNGKAPALSTNEFIQFLHPDINGPGRCKRLCPSKASPAIKNMHVIPMFGTRVLVTPLDAGNSADDLIFAARPLLGDLEALSVDVTPVQQAASGWHRDETVSLAAFVCDGASELWLADPRGAWPYRRFDGAVDSSTNTLLGVEPKAPFHWHGVVTCNAGEAVIFPAWIYYQLSSGSVRGFVFRIKDASGTEVGWQFPLPPLLCQLPEVSSERGNTQDEL